VSKDVGKVGNNSPSFIVPIDSAENKNNIANFFGNQAKAKRTIKREDHEAENDDASKSGATMEAATEEHNAPLPKPKNGL